MNLFIDAEKGWISEYLVVGESGKINSITSEHI